MKETAGLALGRAKSAGLDSQRWREVPVTAGEDISVPVLGHDLLIGAAAIAVFLFEDAHKRRRVYYLASRTGRARLPTFKMGNTIYARRSVLLRWISEMESCG